MPFHKSECKGSEFSRQYQIIPDFSFGILGICLELSNNLRSTHRRCLRYRALPPFTSCPCLIFHQSHQRTRQTSSFQIPDDPFEIPAEKHSGRQLSHGCPAENSRAEGFFPEIHGLRLVHKRCIARYYTKKIVLDFPNPLKSSIFAVRNQQRY